MAKEYEISKVTERCRCCRRELAPGEEIVATVRESGEEFVREDFCAACWDHEENRQHHDILAVWRSVVPRPEEKRKKLFVDDDLLINFFERLEGADEPAKVNFRFVLTLILMRKRLLKYDESRTEDGKEIWRLRIPGDKSADNKVEVVNPHLDEEQIEQLSSQIGEILHTDL